jgi:hypothetical protein
MKYNETKSNIDHKTLKGNKSNAKQNNEISKPEA